MQAPFPLESTGATRLTRLTLGSATRKLQLDEHVQQQHSLNCHVKDLTTGDFSFVLLAEPAQGRWRVWQKHRPRARRPTHPHAPWWRVLAGEACAGLRGLSGRSQT